MIELTQENRESFKYHLTAFYHQRLMEGNSELSIGQVADNYIDNEMSMQKGMQDYHDYLNEENRKNKRLLRAIKKVKGATFHKYLLEIIEESEGIKGLAEIVKTPSGTFQKEQYGRQISGIWVSQWSVGMEGDSWNGIVCVEIKPNKYFKFSYSM